MEAPAELTIQGVRYVRADIERWYSVAELSEMSGFSLSSIYRAMEDGRLRYKCPSTSDVGRRVSQSEWTRFTSEL